MNIGFPGLILILVIALVIFGPKKLPEIGKAAGHTLREFKTSAQETVHNADKDSNEPNEETKRQAKNKHTE